MALVQLSLFPDVLAAEIVRGRLASEGIEAVLFDAGLSSLAIGSLTPVRLMVPEEERSRAEAILGETGA